MFGLNKIVANVVKSAVNTVDEFIEDPIGKSIDIATKPVRDTIDIIDGLSEGELRTKAALSLGVDVVSGMALSEVLDWYSNTE